MNQLKKQFLIDFEKFIAYMIMFINKIISEYCRHDDIRHARRMYRIKRISKSCNCPCKMSFEYKYEDISEFCVFECLNTRTSLTQKGRQSASGEGRKLPVICLGAINHDCRSQKQSVGSRTTNGQMRATSQGEFDDFPGWRDRPNHADRLDIASRVLSARTPRKTVTPHAKKSPSVYSVEAAYELSPSKAS